MVSNYRKNITLFNVLNQEIVFTEYFCNLLRIDEFRELFIDFIGEKVLELSDKIKYVNFNTEVSLEKDKYGRADLFLEINGEKFIFEIKNKCTTKLTENQPIGYLKYLKDKNTHLFFLIPKAYNHTDEIIKEWEKYNEYDKTEISNQIFYWQDFISKVKEKNIENVEIKMFYDFCEFWFNMQPIDLEDMEKELLKGMIVNDFTNKSIPKLMKKLMMIVEQIGFNCGLKESKEISIEGFYYEKKIGDYILYFGIDYDYWASSGTPLSIIIQNKDGNDFELDIEQLKKLDSIETSSSNIYFGYCLDMENILLEDNYQNIIESRLNNIKRYLKQKESDSKRELNLN